MRWPYKEESERVAFALAGLRAMLIGEEQMGEWACGFVPGIAPYKLYRAVAHAF